MTGVRFSDVNWWSHLEKIYAESGFWLNCTFSDLETFVPNVLDFSLLTHILTAFDLCLPSV